MTEEDEEFNRIEREAKQRMEAVSAALDKKAENARELGLDYEPAQQEPFGYFRYDLRLDAWVQNRAGLTGTPFYTSTPAQQDIQRLSALVRAQQITIDKLEAQRTWVDLTGDEIVNMLPDDDTPMSLGEAFFKFAELVEAKLRSKNT